MKIGIDLMGGDHPEYIVGAIKKFLDTNSNDEVYGFAYKGDSNAQEIEKLKNVKIIYCEERVEKSDDPAFIVRKKKESSLVVGSKYAKEGKIDVFISAENTAAIVACGIFVLKRIDDISKPALPGFFPKAGSTTPVMMLDLGANIYATEENMIQYYELADKYMKMFYGLENPKVKLLNIGEEENKGVDLQKKVYQNLKEKTPNFLGNLEPRDVLTPECDIILMDGWTGNIMLKTLEGSMEFVGKNLKSIFYKNIINKIGALLLKKDLMAMYSEFDYKKFGATPVLGVDGLLLKAHGSSDEKAFYYALIQGKKLAEIDFINKIKN